MTSAVSLGDGVTMGNLDSFFQSLIKNVMQVESQPLTDLQTKRDSISVKQGAYSDVTSQLNDLQSATWALQNKGTTSLTLGSQAAVSGAPSGSTVITASAASSAIAGTYNISLAGDGMGLAMEQRVRSDQQTYADQGLGLAGTFVVGGAASRSHGSDTTNANVTAFGVATLATGQTELGSGNYKVETRQDPNNSAWYQFRLVDADGNAVSIQQGTTGNYANGWQAIPTGGGAYDTGRGLTLTFASGGYTATSGSSAANTTYRSKGVAIDVAATDSLNSIADKINKATFAAGNEVTASVIDRQLVLAAKSTGTTHTVHAADTSGTVLKSLGLLSGTTPDVFKNEMQAARNAIFTVNGLTVTRSSNTNLTNVISGVTLNLASDAAGKSATLTVASDPTGARSAIDTFVSKFNSMTSYLHDRTGITSTTSNGVTTYTRGSLNGDSAFSDLRQSLLAAFMNNATNSGTLTNLRQLGLALTDDLQITVSDSDKLNNALTSNLSNTQQLIGAFADQVDALVGRFTGKTNGQSDIGSGYLTGLQSSLASESDYINNSITSLTITLNKREQSLIDQFGEMQSQLYLMQYQQQQWQSIYSSFSSSA